MLLIIKFICICLLATLTYQDFKERKVLLWVLLVSILCLGFLHWWTTSSQLFWIQSLQNLSILLLLFLILFLYARYKMKIDLMTGIGVGDLLFMLGLAIGFPTYSFIILLVGSLCFSLLIFLILKSNMKTNTVPLVGLQALFLGLIFSVNGIFNFINLYAF